MGVKLVTDSTSYLETKTQQDLNITVIPLGVNFPDESFRETEVDYEYFYNKIDTSGIIPTSSQPSQGEIYKTFEDIVEQGDDIVAVFISSEMSGTFQTAQSARNMLLEKYPKAKVELVDSRINCMALGLIVIEAAKAAKEGKIYQEVLSIAKSMVRRVNFYFIPASLEYLKKGGRIGGAAALIGTVLNIKPILYVNDGKTEVLKKARGLKNAVDNMLKVLENDEKLYGLKSIAIHHINCYERANELANNIVNLYGKVVDIIAIGPVIGLHVGPGAIGIVYSTEK